MMSGLKNWDQGRMDLAVPFFKEVAGRNERRSPAWMKPYIMRARDYLDDARLLSGAEPATFEVEPELAREMADDLQAVYDKLKTKGRARFNVRSWQLELERQARQVRRPGPASPNSGRGQFGGPGALADRIKACQFDEATQILRRWRPKNDKDREKKMVYSQLLQSSQVFLAEIGESAEGSEVEIAIKTRDQRDYVKVIGGGVHHLNVQDSEGKEAKLPWSEIDPESLILLHRELVKSGGGHIDAIRRHEHAVSFDFLAGDRGRAIEAAKRLGRNSELFARRWKLVESVLGD